MNTRLVSVDEVIRKAIVDAGMEYGMVSREDLVEWAASGIKQIGAYDTFESTDCEIDVENYRATLPEDFFAVDYMKFTSKHRIHMGYILCEQETGKITLSYLRLPVDEYGYPLIPDNEDVKEALMWNFLYRLSFRREYSHPQFDARFCKNEWEQHKLHARAVINMPSMPDWNKAAVGFRTWLGNRPEGGTNGYLVGSM